MQVTPSPQHIQMVPVLPVVSQQIDRFELNNRQDLFVRQIKRGWCEECSGCEAQTEFKISTKSAPKSIFFSALEDSSCCLRFFCCSHRPFTINVLNGRDHVARYHRPFACPALSCKICCRQSIIFENNATRNGKIEEDFYCFIPTFKVLKEDGTHQYNIHQPTCCGGNCVDPFAEGCCTCREPYYIFVPGSSGATGSQTGKIVKVSNCCSTSNAFELDFPNGIDSDTKLRLLGGVFLINQLYFEDCDYSSNCFLCYILGCIWSWYNYIENWSCCCCCSNDR